MKYDPVWLQEEANRLGSWNKVCLTHKISPRTIDNYKKKNLIQNVYVTTKVDLDVIQSMYDSGMSIQTICEELNIPHSSFSSKIKTRSPKEARRIANHSFSTEGLAKLSENAQQRGLGGYRPHPNRGMRYNGVWFDSSWEVKVAKSLDFNNIIWERPKTGFVWSDQGNTYYPDFYLSEYDVYLDPKNEYLREKDRLKIAEAQSRNKIKVIVLDEFHLEWDKIALLL